VQWSRDGNLGQKKWTGENPPAGALITYFLKTQPSGEVNITITDKDGRNVRRMRRVSDDAGLNRVAWDLRTDAPAGGGGGRGGRGGGGGAAGAQPTDADTSLAAVRARRAAAQSDAEQGGGDEGGGGGRGGGGGLDVLPGTYTVAVSVNGKQLTKPVQVQLDPRSDMTAAQLVTQNQTAAQLNDILARVNRVITGADDLLAQLTSLQTQLRREQSGGVVQQGQVLGDIDGTIKDLRHFRDSVLARPLPGLGYRQYPRLREEAQTVAGMVSRPMMPPTAGELLRMNELRTEADQAQARLDAIVSGRIAKINQSLAGTPHVITPARPVIP
jgi:hypothetical protein